MRLFFGIGLSPDIRSEVNSFSATLKAQLPKMRWVEARNLHITLRFLGEVDEKRIPEISSAAQEAARSITRFEIILGQLGAFPNSRKARVFWWGLAQGAEESIQLFKQLERNLVSAGFKPEPKRYHPHLTLARLRYPAPLPLDSLTVPEGLSLTVSSYVLYQSTLTPQGPIYKTIEEFKLG